MSADSELPTLPFGAESTAEEVSEGLDLSGQRWLITGVNSGLGYETARVLAKRGARIVGAARTAEKAEKAFEQLGIEGDPVACELSNLDTVRAAVDTIKGLGQLDGIIANAGIMALPELQQVEGIEKQFFTNHMGHFVLVSGLLEQLSDSARVVMLSSGAHFYAKRGLELENLSGEDDYDPWRMYGRSKLANILFALSLSEKFEGSKRTANAVHPGVIETNLGRHVPDREAMYERLKPMTKSVGAGAATQVAVALRPEFAEVSGYYFSDCNVAKAIPEARDSELAARLWAKSEELARA